MCTKSIRRCAQLVTHFFVHNLCSVVLDFEHISCIMIIRRAQKVHGNSDNMSAPRFMGSGIGYQSPCKRYDRPEIACWGFGCSNSEERMCKYECWQETSGTAWKQNPRRNFQGTWDHQIFLCHVWARWTGSPWWSEGSHFQLLWCFGAGTFF